MVCTAFIVFLKVINMINDILIQRIPTKIYGLDKLLYGGLLKIKNLFTGGTGTESTLLDCTHIWNSFVFKRGREECTI